MLSREATRSFYDRFGSRQDSQAFYEDQALEQLVALGDFENAQHVFEFGVGTGRFADRLLSSQLGPNAQYTGVDISSTMVSLAQTRLAHYGARVKLSMTDGTPRCSVPEGTVDRVVSTYVLDLLPVADIHQFLTDCTRALSESGKLCLVSLTYGETLASRTVTGVWHSLFKMSPRLVGGCRPIRLGPILQEAGVRVAQRRVVIAFGVASEVIVAETQRN